jgi:hypothetical protein
MRRLNWPLWLGFIVSILALVGYEMLFVRFPITRDVPWVSYLLLAVALVLVAAGFRRAQRKIVPSIVAFLTVALTALFCIGTSVGTRMPSSPAAPAVGAKAPGFTLPDTNNRPVTLARLLAAPGSKGVLLVFYRGYW